MAQSHNTKRSARPGNGFAGRNDHLLFRPGLSKFGGEGTLQDGIRLLFEMAASALTIIGGIALVYRLKVEPAQQEFRRQLEGLKKDRDDADREIEARRKESSVAAKEEVYRLRAEMERENREKRADVGRLERRLAQKEEQLDRRGESLEKREGTLGEREVDADRLRNELNNLINRQRSELERVANLPADEARAQVLKAVEDESRHEAARLIRDIENEAKREGERRAR